MKTLNQFLQRNESTDRYAPEAEGQKRFVAKHFDKNNRPIMAPGHEGPKDRAGNDVAGVYNGKIETAPRPGHGYAAAPSKEDEQVYEGKTFRREKSEKKGSSIKKYLQKKKDEKRLQEEAPELDEANKSSLDDPMHPANAAHGAWEDHHAAINDTLDKIKDIMKGHKKAVVGPHKQIVPGAAGVGLKTPFEKSVKGKANWSEAETLKHHRRTLEDFHDNLAGKGEYAHPSGSGLRREEAEEEPNKMVEALGEEFAAMLEQVLEQVEGEAKEILETLIANEDWEAIASIFTDEEEAE